MEVQQITLEGIDHAGLMKLIRAAQKDSPDRSLGVAKTTRPREVTLVSMPVKNKRVEGPVTAMPWSGHLKDAPVLDKLTKAVLEKIPTNDKGWDVLSWANTINRGDYYEKHDHIKSGYETPDNEWAAIYYINAPEGSRIRFHDGETKEDVQPQTGMLLIFPAGLEHEVPIYDGTDERVSIAFNIRPRG